MHDLNIGFNTNVIKCPKCGLIVIKQFVTGNPVALNLKEQAVTLYFIFALFIDLLILHIRSMALLLTYVSLKDEDNE